MGKKWQALFVIVWLVSILVWAAIEMFQWSSELKFINGYFGMVAAFLVGVPVSEIKGKPGCKAVE